MLLRGVGIDRWFHTGVSELNTCTYSVGCGFTSRLGCIYKFLNRNTKEINQENDIRYVVWLPPSECGGFTGTFQEAEM